MATPVALRCSRCGTDFEFTADEQEDYRARKQPSPSLCRRCLTEPEPLGEAICPGCGRPSLVRVHLPNRTQIYCEDCFEERVSSRYGGGRSGDRLG
jgi:Probable zinc-ribbon domain